jgi:dTDP-4-amino-4,6-dideoxygalactose transaminase
MSPPTTRSASLSVADPRSPDKIMTPPANSPPRIYLSPPHVSDVERNLLLDAFDSNWIAPLGPHVDAFEREFAARVGARHAVATSSGTAALHLALRILGIGPGDRVATSTLTFVASANAIRYRGAEPVFIDSNRRSWNLDPNLLADELQQARRQGKPYRAVLAVDVLGQCAEFEPIRAVCADHDAVLVEDAAEALGATYQGRSAGTFGHIGCFSFNGNKIITTSGGGMLVTDRQDWADAARFLATQARDPAPHYEHHQLGYNYRLSNLLAAVGRGQLQALDDRVARRREIFRHYQQTLGQLPGVQFMPEPPEMQSTRWLTCLTIDPDALGVSCDEIRVALESHNIEARPLWKPMHQQPLYAGCHHVGGEVSEDLFRHGLCLPSGSSMTDSDLTRVVQQFLKATPHSSSRPD